MPTYAEQVLISTGRSNWPSKIDEDECEDSALVRQLRKNLLRDGKYSDVSVDTPPVRTPC